MNTLILFQPILNVCRHICQESTSSTEPVCVSQVLKLSWRPRLHNSDGKELLDVLSMSGTALKKLILGLSQNGNTTKCLQNWAR